MSSRCFFVRYVSRDGRWLVSHFDELQIWRSVLLSYIQQRLLLVGERARVLLSRHVIFPTNSRREVVLSIPKGHCWMKQSISLVPVSLSFMHVQILLLVSGFWELLNFWIYFIVSFLFLFINFHKYLQDGIGLMDFW